MKNFNALAQAKQVNELPKGTKPKDPTLGGDAHIIVFGNEKGGSGKSTTAMHVAIALLRLGYKVATIDLDARQGTISRYILNRLNFIKSHNKYVPCPDHRAVRRSTAKIVADQEREEKALLDKALNDLKPKNHFIIIDAPGSDCYVSRLAHSYADTLITPLNDSFVDLDLLASIDPKTYKIKGSSVYCRMVEEQRYARYQRDGGKMNWIVVRNRLSALNAKNKQIVGKLLEDISERAKFSIAPGFGERVVFRELFLKGLTLLDLKDDPKKPMTMSQLKARQEVRQLIIALDPKSLKGSVHPLKKKARG